MSTETWIKQAIKMRTDTKPFDLSDQRMQKEK